MIKIKKENYGTFILSASLAIESFNDDNELSNEEENQIIKMYDVLREYREKFYGNVDKQKEVIDIIINTINLLGEDRFIFYDDGDVNYKWKGGIK